MIHSKHTFLGFVIIWFAVCYCTGVSEDTLLARADRAYREKRYEVAIEVYQKLIEEKKLSYEFTMRLARMYAWTKRYDNAKQIYLDILSMNKDNTEALLALAGVLCWDKKLDSAYALYELAVKREPENTEAVLGLGRVTMFQGKWREAKRIFKEGLSLDPDNSDLIEAHEHVSRILRPELDVKTILSRETEQDFETQKDVIGLLTNMYSAGSLIKWSAQNQTQCNVRYGLINEQNLIHEYYNYQVWQAAGIISHRLRLSERWKIRAHVSLVYTNDRHNALFRVRGHDLQPEFGTVVFFFPKSVLLTASYNRSHRLIKDFSAQRLLIIAKDSWTVEYQHKIGEMWRTECAGSYSSYGDDRENKNYNAKVIVSGNLPWVIECNPSIGWHYSNFKYDVPEYYSYDYQYIGFGEVKLSIPRSKPVHCDLSYKVSYTYTGEFNNPHSVNSTSPEIIDNLTIVRLWGHKATCGLCFEVFRLFRIALKGIFFQNTDNYRTAGFEMGLRL